MNTSPELVVAFHAWLTAGAELAEIAGAESRSTPSQPAARLNEAERQVLAEAAALVKVLKVMAIHPSHYAELESAIASVQGGAA